MKNLENIGARWGRPKEARQLLGCGNTKFYEILKSHRLVTKKIDGMRLIWLPSIQNIGEAIESEPARGPLS